MPPKRRARSDNTATRVPQNDAKVIPTDDLVFQSTDAVNKFTIARLFKEKLNSTLGKVSHPDWNMFRDSLENRTSTSPAWYLRVGEEEVGTEPAAGQMMADVVRVQFVTIAEAASNTLAPRTFVIREHRVYADDEDYVPEKVCSFKDHGWCWLEILKDDLTSCNSYLLCSVSEKDQLMSKPMDFGFGGKSSSSASAATTTATAAVTESSSSNNNCNETQLQRKFSAGFGNQSAATAVSSTSSVAPPPSTASTQQQQLQRDFSSGFGSSSSSSNNANANVAGGGGGGSFSTGFGGNTTSGFGGGNTTTSDSASSQQTATTTTSGFVAPKGDGGFSVGFGAASTTTLSTQNSFSTGGFGSSSNITNTTSDNSSNVMRLGSFGSQNQNTENQQLQRNFSSGFGASQTTTTTTATTTTASPSSNTENTTTDAAAASATTSSSTTTKKEHENKSDTDLIAAKEAIVSGLPRHSKDVDFVVWDNESIREMRKITSQGSRIVRREFDLGVVGGEEKWKKLVMQNDLHDKPDKVVQESIEKKFFQTNKRCKKFQDWRETCPEIDPKISEPLDTMSAKLLLECKKSYKSDFDKLLEHKSALLVEVKKIVALRKEEVESELEVLDSASSDIKQANFLPRKHWRVVKFYPKNDVVRFRPHGKAGRLTDGGNSLDECHPPAYVRQNTFGSFVKS